MVRGRGDTHPRPRAACAGVLAVVLVGVLTMTSCAQAPTAPTPIPPAAKAKPVDQPLAPIVPAPNVPGDPEQGRRLLITTGCGGCHTVRGVPGAAGVVAPDLTNVVLRPTLAGETIPMSPETMTQWLIHPASLKPATTMPSVGLTAEQARDITAFLFSQPYNPLLQR